MATSRSGSVLYNARTAHGKIKPGDRDYVKPYRPGKTRRDKLAGVCARRARNRRARAEANSARATGKR